MTLAGERACGVAEACAQLAQRARRREACLRRLVGSGLGLELGLGLGSGLGLGLGVGLGQGWGWGSG